MNGAPSAMVSPGLWGFVAFFALAVALYLLMRNMNARMRRMSYRAELERDAEREKDGRRETDAGRDKDAGPHKDAGRAASDDPDGSAGSADENGFGGQTGNPGTGAGG
jgi:hypothetical protein